MCLSTQPLLLQAKTFLDYSQIKVDSYKAQTCTDAGRAKTHMQTRTKTDPRAFPTPPPLTPLEHTNAHVHVCVCGCANVAMELLV